ncbi:hypothetical protein Bca101_066046 [Brassica carinata]
MVSVRLVDQPDSPEEYPVGYIPEMMFAVGEEPVGVRVITYLSSGAINRIYEALEDDEVQIIRRSSFGKILEIAEKPTKLKATISEKPYWPSLFGKIEVATVASVIRMLRKHTVEDRIVRIKYACLAILSSVLLPTNVKMKICREHVEAIEDLDEFFSYPWGRLAFDMLMCSIKERDEIALSQNTIAVKGFALALQLVMVEAVPCLNEVIQETCSSSEGDSEEDVEEKSGKPKRKTLSPGHARNIDKQSDVLVRSIIDEDPLRPVDESEFVWSDEEEDEKVEHMVFLINNNFNFTKSMFVGGVSKLDVDRMRAAENVSSKLKKPKKQPAFSMSNDPGYIASIVIQNVKPQLQTMEGNILRASTRLDSIEGSLLGLVESVFAKFKEEMLESVRCLVPEFTKGDEAGPSRIQEKGNQTACMDKGNMAGSNVSPVRDANAQSIRNILGNLSAYSTPLASPRLSLGENLSPTNRKDVLYRSGDGENVNESIVHSAHSQNHHRSLDLNQPLEVGNRGQANHFDMPSFSLGLTQEERLDVAAGISPTEFVGLVPCPIVAVGEKSDDPQNSRKSKRQKCVPQALVDDYQCGPDIVSRVRKSQKFIFAFDESREMDMKYERLGEEVKGSGLIKIGGVAVSGKDIQLIAERTRCLTTKVVDILIRVLEYSLEQHFHVDFSQMDVYLDSKYTSAIIRTYPRFSKSRKKESFVFPSGLVQPFDESNVSCIHRRRYYFPINVCKKHWVGVCVDPRCGKFTVLDCNTSLYSDVMMEKHLHPHLAMIPHLLRLSGHALPGDERHLLEYERPKCVSQTHNSFDSGLMVVLLMATHVVYGIEACKNINSNILAEEGKSNAIMAFELQEIV